MYLVQVEFQCGQTSKLVWVDSKWKLITGDKVSFEEDERIWTAIKVYKTAISLDSINKKWGLDLPNNQRTER